MKSVYNFNQEARKDGADKLWDIL